MRMMEVDGWETVRKAVCRRDGRKSESWGEEPGFVLPAGAGRDRNDSQQTFLDRELKVGMAERTLNSKVVQARAYLQTQNSKVRPEVTFIPIWQSSKLRSEETPRCIEGGFEEDSSVLEDGGSTAQWMNRGFPSINMSTSRLDGDKRQDWHHSATG